MQWKNEDIALRSLPKKPVVKELGTRTIAKMAESDVQVFESSGSQSGLVEVRIGSRLTAPLGWALKQTRQPDYGKLDIATSNLTSDKIVDSLAFDTDDAKMSVPRARLLDLMKVRLCSLFLYPSY